MAITKARKIAKRWRPGPRPGRAGGQALLLRRLSLSQATDAELWLAGPAESSVVPELWNTLSSGEQERANRFHRAEDRALFALTRGTLRYLLSEATGIAAEKIAFAEGAFGKPYLSEIRAPHFNVSHSGSFALIGLSKSRPIGVDIEQMRSTSDELKVARVFFSDAEYHMLQSLEKDARLLAFYKIWTCKEAVLKAYGAGISEHLRQFSVELTGDGFAVHPESNWFSPTLGPISAAPAAVPPGYTGCCALVSRAEGDCLDDP
jgi:4'-phosphopantetheinyl transferase